MAEKQQCLKSFLAECVDLSFDKGALGISEGTHVWVLNIDIMVLKEP